MSQATKALFFVGTRPEAIKIAPIVRAALMPDCALTPYVCFTGQHRELLSEIAQDLELVPDENLGLMKSGQSLAELTSNCLLASTEVIQRIKPDCVIAQGDTTTVFAVSLAAFYERVPFIHVEAGLRSFDLDHPHPEEYNRRAASIATAIHCAPTKSAQQNLLREGVRAESIHITGNTVIDTLLWMRERQQSQSAEFELYWPELKGKKVILVTAHRRESFGAPLQELIDAIKALAQSDHDLHFFLPLHPNPSVREPLRRALGSHPQVCLSEALNYPQFVWMMDRSCLILTDSGGVQEEAPSLNKPVLVLRQTTERQEAVELGLAEMVGMDSERIISASQKILADLDAGGRASRSASLVSNPYGDGQAGRRIVELLKTRAWE